MVYEYREIIYWALALKILSNFDLSQPFEKLLKNLKIIRKGKYSKCFGKNWVALETSKASFEMIRFFGF